MSISRSYKDCHVSHLDAYCNSLCFIPSITNKCWLKFFQCTECNSTSISVGSYKFMCEITIKFYLSNLLTFFSCNMTTEALISITSFLIVVILLSAPSGLNPVIIKDFTTRFALFLCILFRFTGVDLILLDPLENSHFHCSIHHFHFLTHYPVPHPATPDLYQLQLVWTLLPLLNVRTNTLLTYSSEHFCIFSASPYALYFYVPS